MFCVRSLSVGRKDETSQGVNHSCELARRSRGNARTSRLTLEQSAHPFRSHRVTLSVAKDGIPKSSPLAISADQEVESVEGTPIFTFNGERAQVTSC